MREAVDAFAEHLAGVRSRSAHTVRAYVTDLVSLLHHAVRMGCANPLELDLTVLRSWLAKQRTMGAARTSLARPGRLRPHVSAWRTGPACSPPTWQPRWPVPGPTGSCPRSCGLTRPPP